MTLIIFFNLLLTFSLIFLFGGYFGKKGSIFIAKFNIILCFFVIKFVFLNRFNAQENFVEFVYISSWLSIFDVKVSWNLLLDNLSITMMLIVITISACVHIYSSYYVGGGKNIVKFFSYLTLFTFFMCLLVMASNFFMLFVGWESVGICSFLLIKLLNRVGDFFLLVAVVFIVLNFKTVEYSAIFPQIFFIQHKIFFIRKNVI